MANIDSLGFDGRLATRRRYCVAAWRTVPMRPRASRSTRSRAELSSWRCARAFPGNSSWFNSNGGITATISASARTAIRWSATTVDLAASSFPETSADAKSRSSAAGFRVSSPSEAATISSFPAWRRYVCSPRAVSTRVETAPSCAGSARASKGDVRVIVYDGAAWMPGSRLRITTSVPVRRPLRRRALRLRPRRVWACASDFSSVAPRSPSALLSR